MGGCESYVHGGGGGYFVRGPCKFARDTHECLFEAVEAPVQCAHLLYAQWLLIKFAHASTSITLQGSQD